MTEQYLNSYSQEDMQQVNDLVDPEVIFLLGYEKKEIPRGA